MGVEGGRKIVWVKWNEVYLPEAQGGLRIKKNRLFNMVLLGKWRWRLASYQNDLWLIVLKSKFVKRRSGRDST